MASFIPKIKTLSGKLAYSSPHIASTFKDFYAQLYNVQGDFSVSDRCKRIRAYLKHANLPPLPRSLLKTLELEFSIDELRTDFQSMLIGKAPGPGGYTVLYKTFSDTLLPYLTAYANSINTQTGLRPESLKAHISVIPKPGKYPSFCSSYRPISLLNVHVKLFTKVLATICWKRSVMLLGPFFPYGEYTEIPCVVDFTPARFIQVFIMQFPLSSLLSPFLYCFPYYIPQLHP